MKRARVAAPDGLDKGSNFSWRLAILPSLVACLRPSFRQVAILTANFPFFASRCLKDMISRQKSYARFLVCISFCEVCLLCLFALFFSLRLLNGLSCLLLIVCKTYFYVNLSDSASHFDFSTARLCERGNLSRLSLT